MSTFLDSGWLRPLGGSGEQISAITLGASPLGGGLERLYGPSPGEAEAVATVRAAMGSPITAIDTANGYSGGESERRIGRAIALEGGLPEGFLVITKVDPRAGDFSGPRIRESVRESKERLGVDRLPLVHLHDPDIFPFEDVTARGGALATLLQLRAEGEIEQIGLAGGVVQEMARYLDLGVFDSLLVHNRLTIVDRSAADLVRQASESGLSIFNAAVYGGGILTTSSASTNYGYRPAPPRVLEAIVAIRELCAEWESDLSTVALQFSLRHAQVTSTVVGMSRPSRVAAAIAVAAGEPLDDRFWIELESLVPERSSWLDFRSAS